MLNNISFKNIRLNNGFWQERFKLNRDVSIQSVYERFEETGRFDALRFQSKEKGSEPHVYYDSDVAKWIEAVAYLIDNGEACEKEQAIVDDLVARMQANQWENGYLNSYFIQVAPDQVFTDRHNHELYCAGHLIEAAIAYKKATGKGLFLEIMCKYLDCIERAFILDKTAKFVTPGHEEIEIALLKLYEYTKEKRYLDMAMFFLNQRGVAQEPHMDKNIQSEMPIRALTEAEGHAVRAAYLYTAMCDAARITGDDELQAACQRLFDNVVQKRLFITGGIGSARSGESFTVPYDLPNLETYSESCAAIGLLLFALSMQRAGRNAKYAAVIERVMYNTLLSSTSLDGKAFFYENPLEYHLASVDKETSTPPERRIKLPIRHRLEVFYCSCCPPNVNRTIARIGDVFFSESDTELIVNQYAALQLQNERIHLTLDTQYPLNGKVVLRAENNRYATIALRIPEWCEQYVLNGEISAKKEDGYLIIENAPNAFVLELDFLMQPYFLQANPKVRDDCGRVALCYGPTVYCMERLDNDYELNALSVPLTQSPTQLPVEDYLLPDLLVNGFVDPPFEGLYRRATTEKIPVQLRFKPYWTFANREECDMLVWVRANDKIL